MENFDPVIASQDNFAPGRISDLTVEEAIYGTDYFTIRWTTPGDDLTYGIGALLLFIYVLTFYQTLHKFFFLQLLRNRLIFAASGYELSVWYETYTNKTSNETLLVPEAAITTDWADVLLPAGEVVNVTVTLGRIYLL